MKIVYIANMRMPTERAHGIQVVKTCEALALAGAHVRLIVPRRKTHITDTSARYYELKQAFPIVYAAALDVVAWGKFGFFLESCTFALSARRLLRTGEVVYCRDELVLALLYILGVRKAAWETHTGAWNIAARFVAARLPIVAISQGLKDFYRERGVPAAQIAVAHDGVDVAALVPSETRAAARERLHLPQEHPIAMYIGSLGGWKGVEVLLDASRALQGAAVAIVGGTQKELAPLRARYPEVHFLGASPYRDMANAMAAADVLVLPNTARAAVSSRFTSPLKLFAYMTSGKPIVASDLPSLREVLDDNSAFFVRPDDAQALAEGIGQALTDATAQAKARAAQEKVREYDWQARAKRILDHLHVC